MLDLALYGHIEKPMKNIFKKRSINQGSSLKRKRVRLNQNETEGVVKTKAYKRHQIMGINNYVNDNKKYVSSDYREKDDDPDKFRLLSGEQEKNKESEAQESSVNSKSENQCSAIATSKNVKVSILTDFHPDVCKDFKQTGYCGYGNSCKFLHSRDDFKTGWKMNQEWKIDDEGERKVEECVPFKCVICKREYRSPVVTNCGHYFCSSCFMQRVRRDSKCVVCKQETDGVVQIAKNFKKSILGDAKRD